VTAAVGLTEELIQKGIVDCLEVLGFGTYHTRFSIGSDDGFPDVVGLRADGAIVAVECKGPRGRLTDRQLDWIQRFRQNPGCLFAEVVGPETTSAWVGYDEAIARLHEVLG
jgi:hypothetical protein